MTMVFPDCGDLDYLNQMETVRENSGMQDMTANAMIPKLRKALKRLHYPLEVMLVCTR